MFGVGKGIGGGGGGGAGGGDLLRTASRVATSTNFQEPFSSYSNSSTNTSQTSTTTTTNSRSRSRSTQKPNSISYNQLSISSSGSIPLSPYNLQVSANSGLPIWGSGFGSQSVGSCCESDDLDWVSVEGSDNDSDGDYFHSPVHSSVPSLDEVRTAVSAIQQGFDAASHSELVTDKYAYNDDNDIVDQISSPSSRFHRVSSSESEMDWMEPSLYICNSRTLQTYGFDRVYDAFHLLRTETSVQKMVISLSSDQAVWDAIMSNEVVKELKESYSTAAASNNNTENSDKNINAPNSTKDFVTWIFESTMTKLKEALEKITRLLNELFKPQPDQKTQTNQFGTTVRTSIMLSIVVLLVVVVTRATKGLNVI